MAGYVISPFINGDYRQDGDCAQDVIANYERIGHELANIIPGGSQIYWDVRSAVPLLYLHDVKLHLAQVYGGYSYLGEENANDGKESGYWYKELALRWMAEAEYLVVEEGSRFILPAPEDVINLNSYSLTVLPPVNPCKIWTRLFVYQRSP